MKIKTSAKQIAPLLKQCLYKDVFANLSTVVTDELPEVVYTSFDGDMLSHSELMKQHVLKKGLVPLNPESALGTYLVTNHYEGDKGPIIEDCLSLIGLVDQFYVMSTLLPEGEHEIKKLPEGVIAEVLYWASTKGKPVNYVDISHYTDEAEIDHSNELLDKLDVKQKAGIKKAVDATRKLRPVAYLMSGEMHAKHSDWMRKDAYNNALVPLCPYTLINFSTLQSAHPDDHVRQIVCRAALAYRADEVRVYGPLEEGDFELSKLPVDALTELYVILLLQPKKSLVYKSFANIGVPKYANRKKWAITDFEREQAE